MIGSVVHDWFGFPNGAVLTNLVAWIIGLVCGLAPMLWQTWKSHQDLHAKLDRIHAHLGIDKEKP